MRATLAYVAHASAAVRVSFADRANFALQAGGMVLNNVFVLALWFLFFQGFKSIGGWRMPDMALLVGVLATTVGVCGVAFGGYRDLAATILRGEPDTLLTQPRAVLWRLLARDSSMTGWGDVLTGAVLLTAFARIPLGGLPLLLLALACSAAVYLSIATSFACIAFWARGARSFARDLTDFVLSFSSYPGSMYSGAAKLMVYTVFPAGFIVLAPVELLRHPSAAQALGLVAAAAAYGAFALWLFGVGLKRYRRGEAPIVGA